MKYAMKKVQNILLKENFMKCRGKYWYKIVKPLIIENYMFKVVNFHDGTNQGDDR
jgi:hypothetical protein